MHNGWRAVLSVAMLLAAALLIAQKISPSRGWAIALHGGADKDEWELMDAATAAALWPISGLLSGSRLPKRDQFNIPNACRRCAGWCSRGIKRQALAGGGRVNEVGKDGFTVFGKDLN